MDYDFIRPAGEDAPEEPVTAQIPVPADPASESAAAEGGTVSPETGVPSVPQQPSAEVGTAEPAEPKAPEEAAPETPAAPPAIDAEPGPIRWTTSGPPAAPVPPSEWIDRLTSGVPTASGSVPVAPAADAVPTPLPETAARKEAGAPFAAEPAVRCYGLTKVYGSNPALREVAVELPAGKIIGLLGPNGSGKTTFIKILAGLLQPTAGEVSVFGVKPGVATKAFVSYLPERMYFNPGMRVEECIRLFRDFYGDFDERRAREMLGVLGVPVTAKLKTLSKGTKEKVQLVLVMSRRAKLYLLDEPIGGVDPAARDYILHTIVTAYEPGATVVISTHLIRDVEPILDGFVFIGGGSIVMSGEADAVRADSGKTLDELFREVFRCF